MPKKIKRTMKRLLIRIRRRTQNRSEKPSNSLPANKSSKNKANLKLRHLPSLSSPVKNLNSTPALLLFKNMSKSPF